MSENITLAAEIRERAGKGAARATRRAGRVPAVIYGDNKDPVMVSVAPIDLMKMARGGGFFSHVVDIEAGGTKHRVLPRDMQMHPLTDQPIHVDFLRVSASSVVTVEVQVEFLNEEKCPGLKKGGVLNIVRHAVEVLAKPDAIPETLQFDLATAEIGDTIHVSATTLPAGVELTITDRDFTVATIAAPTVVSEAEAEAEAEEESGED